MRVALFWILIGLSAMLRPNVYGQLKPVCQLPLQHIELAAVDRLGNFYFLLPGQQLRCYNPDGVLQSETTVDAPGITLLEPWNPLKIFLYEHPGQTYRFFDRQLALLETHALDPSLSTRPHLMCPAQEVNKAWILDADEQTLKKVDLNTLDIDLEVKMPMVTAEGIYPLMRAYQNRLFLLDGQVGIHIFNNLGKLITTVPVAGLNYFNFLGEELCYRKDKQVMLMDIYTGEERVAAVLDIDSAILFTLITDERLLVVTDQGVTFYQYELKN